MTRQPAPFSAEVLPADLRSGLVTFLVALPLCLGIALASGAPPLAGIIAGVVGGIVVGSLSGSSLSVSGPAAGLTTIVAAGILKLGTYESFLLAVALAGVLQIGLGYARAGLIANYFPSSVIKGMLASIGLTLILKQIPHALGWDRDAEGELEFIQADGATTFTEISAALANIKPGAVVLTLVAIGVLLLWQQPVFQRSRVAQIIPGALVAVLLALGLNALFLNTVPALALLPSHLVQLPQAGQGGWAALLRLPDFGAFGNPQVYLTAATIALVASLETLLNVEATDKLDPLHRHTPPNRELRAQGVGNLISGLLGGIPVTSVIVRSTVNLNSGARTKASAVIHGVLLLGCVLLIPDTLNRIPLAALAGILLFTGYKLTKPALYAEQWRLGWSQFLPFVVTIAAVLFTDLLIGIGIGLMVGIFFILKANFRTSYVFLRESEAGISDKIRINLADHVSFLNKASIIDILDQLPEDSVVEIDARQSSYVDHDVVEAIDNFRETARLRNIQLTFHPGRAGFAAMHRSEVESGNVIGFETAIDEIASVGVPDPPTPVNPQVFRPLWPAPGATPEVTPAPAPEPDRARYNELFANNRRWVEQKLKLAPTYFEDLARGQKPEFLFIGCADSRVTIDAMTGTNPGEIFVHRNIANLVVPTDLNVLSVVQYAIAVLKVNHVIVLGHYGCGGVKAAMQRQSLGLINKWLIPIRDVMRLHRAELENLPSDNDRFRRLVELSIQEQVYNLCKTSFVQEAWPGQEHLHVHGWVYDIREGLMRDLEIDIEALMSRDDHLYRLLNVAEVS